MASKYAGTKTEQNLREAFAGEACIRACNELKKDCEDGVINLIKLLE